MQQSEKRTGGCNLPLVFLPLLGMAIADGHQRPHRPSGTSPTSWGRDNADTSLDDQYFGKANSQVFPNLLGKCPKGDGGLCGSHLR